MNEQTPDNKRLFLIGMTLSMACWGFSWPSGKILSWYGDPLLISFYRFALTFVSLLLILLFSKVALTIHKKGLINLFIAALIISAYTYFFFQGLSIGKAGAGGVLVTTLNPIITYSITLLITKRKPIKNELLGLGLGLLAGAILLKLPSEADKIFSAGNIYFLLCSFCWAILSLFTARASRYGSSLTFSLWMYGISSVLMFTINEKEAIVDTIYKSDFIFWLNLFFSATITTSLATTFYFIATTKIGASKASSFIFMVPLSAAIGSWIFLHEIPQLHTIIGGIIGIAAVYILNKNSSAKAPVVQHVKE
jgi:drug/metabolite transporter (DMT)-like permease